MYTFTDILKSLFLFVCKISEIFYKHIRKVLDIYERICYNTNIETKECTIYGLQNLLLCEGIKQRPKS